MLDALRTDEPLAVEERIPHKIYLNGQWFVGPESDKHARATGDYEDYIAIIYSARSVNAVITSDSGEPYRVRVTMDGEYLTEENKGADVIIDDFGLFAYTFGVYDGGI